MMCLNKIIRRDNVIPGWHAKLYQTEGSIPPTKQWVL